MSPQGTNAASVFRHIRIPDPACAQPPWSSAQDMVQQKGSLIMNLRRGLCTLEELIKGTMSPRQVCPRASNWYPRAAAGGPGSE